MTILTKTSVKTYFTTGARPTQSNFGDFIDSALFLAETTSQTVVGAMIVSGAFYAAGGLQATTVSATSINLTNAVSAASLHVTNNIDASTGRVTASAATINNQLNAGNIQCTGIVSADALHCSAARIDNGVKFTVTTVSAAGTTQGAAAKLTGIVNQCTGVVNGTTTGFMVPSNINGVPLYAMNVTAVSANLWPPTGGQINNAGANVVFPMAGNTMYTIIPIPGSAYFVK